MPVVANLMHGSTDYWIKDNKGGFVVEKFDDKLWAEKIKLALNISNETLRENSSKIIKIASAKNIDAEYFKRIEAINYTLEHVISLLRGLGGVQQAFISYYEYAQNHTKFKHYVYSTHKRSKKHAWFKNFFIIKKNFFSFLLHLYSKDSIIYFHNRLSSKKVLYLLKLMPSNNIIFHEHGEAWNIKTKQQKKIYQANAKFAKKIIVNSIATESLLIKKFKINEAKLKLAYYGFRDPKIKKITKNKKNIQVGFIGRFEAVKNTHSLIEAANLLKGKNINFLIRVDIQTEKDLKKLAKKNETN